MTSYEGIGDINDTIASIQNWTSGDWAIALGVGYVAWSVLFTTHRGYSKVSEKVGRYKARSEKRAKLYRELGES